MQEELIIAGAGGQGIILIGDLLCLVAISDGKNTTGYPSYGATMRGEKATYTVIISSEEIGSPISEHPDSLLAMNKPSLAGFAKIVKPNGLVIVNHSLAKWQMHGGSEVRVIEIEATDIAQELGDSRAANLVMLGAYIKAKEIVSLESVIKALMELAAKKRGNESLTALNKKALETGFKDKGRA